MFPQISWLNIKFQKTETQFCRWRSTDNNDIDIFLSLENPRTFLLVKEKIWKCIFNTDSEFLQKHTKKQITPSKTTINWLFNDVWYYLSIACFDWKIDVFQQRVVLVCYILNLVLFGIIKKQIGKHYLTVLLISKLLKDFMNHF